MSEPDAPDPAGVRYARHWEPVLAPPGRRLLDRVAALAEETGTTATGMHVLDLGTGTGALALATAGRWPEASITGLDASAAMLSVARQRTAHGNAHLSAGRFSWIVADATAMPLADSTVDVVLCAFVLQLVADRAVVLREVARVTRPRGWFGLAGWLAQDLVLAPDREFDEAVYDLHLEDPEPAADQTPDDVAAGFEDVRIVADELIVEWTRHDYLEFKEGFDEYDLFESLPQVDRERLRERVLARWDRLADEAFTMRAPLLMATARRPASP
jgi:SAM-dependent methyltransferase